MENTEVRRRNKKEKDERGRQEMCEESREKEIKRANRREQRNIWRLK